MKFYCKMIRAKGEKTGLKSGGFINLLSLKRGLFREEAYLRRWWGVGG